MTDDQIKHMTERFLAWELPENFRPDAGISFERLTYNGKPYPMPVGTNLFDYTQAEAMVRHMVDGLNTRTPPTATEEAVEAVARALAEDDLRCSELDMEPGGDEWFESNARAAIAALSTYPVTRADEKDLLDAAVNQNAAMRQELAHVGNLVSDLARAMRVDQANADGSWPDLAGRIQRLIEALRTPAPDSREAVLEEAARECERLADEGDAIERRMAGWDDPSCAHPRGWENRHGDGQRKAAAAIRALTPSDTTADQVGEPQS